MTRTQLLGMYWESVRWEARMKLFWIGVLRLANGGEEAVEAIGFIEEQANPYDQEEDTDDFSGEGLMALLGKREF